MFILDSLMISGIRWTLETLAAAADAERNDDTVLREQLLEAEMRRELGELSEADFKNVETDLLARIREIRARRDGGAGPLALSANPLDADTGSRFNIDATLAGDFHEPAVPGAGSDGGGASATSPAPADAGATALPRRRAASASRRPRASRPVRRKRRA